MVKLQVLFRTGQRSEAYYESYNRFLMKIDELPGLRRKSVSSVYGAMGGRMMRRMENMSEQDRQRMRTEMRAMRERFMNASPEERERMREEMRARFGGGRPGRGRGGRAEGQ